MGEYDLDFSKDTVILNGHVCKALPDKPYIYEIQDEYIIPLLGFNQFSDINIRMVCKCNKENFPNNNRVLYVGDVFNEDFKVFAESLWYKDETYIPYYNIVPKPITDVSDPDTGEYDIDFTKDTIVVNGHICKALPDNPSVYEVQGTYIADMDKWECDRNHHALRVLARRYDPESKVCRLLYLGEFGDLKLREFIYNKYFEDENYYVGYSWIRARIPIPILRINGEMVNDCFRSSSLAKNILLI